QHRRRPRKRDQPSRADRARRRPRQRHAPARMGRLADRRPALLRLRSRGVHARYGLAPARFDRRRPRAALGLAGREPRPTPRPACRRRTGRGAMRIALVNPPWSFDGSIYFGCREPHLALEYGYARQMLDDAGHEVALFDAHLAGLGRSELRAAVAAFEPEMTVVTTAPSYLFWRCAPPGLRGAQATLADRDGIPGLRVAIGSHASTTPRAALRKLGADVAVMGEAEEILVRLAATPRAAWGGLSSTAYRRDGEIV